MKIRKLIIEDYDAVYALWCRTAGMGLNDVDNSREGIVKYLKRNPDTCFVAETENEGGNAFWEHSGFTTRPDLNYRDKALVELRRIDT